MFNFDHFKSLKVDAKIRTGVGYQSITILSLCVLSFLVMFGTKYGFSTYRTTAIGTNQLGRIQANFLEARMASSKYLRVEKQEFIDKFEKRISTINQLVREMREKSDESQSVDFIEKASSEYREAFFKVINFKKERNNIVYNQLNIAGPKIEKNLTAITKSAYRDGDKDAAYYASLSMRNLLLARLYQAKFLDTNDKKTSDRVFKEFSDFQSNFELLKRNLENPERRKRAATISELFSQYQTSFSNLKKTIDARNVVIKKELDKIGPKVASDIEVLKLSNKKRQDFIGPLLNNILLGVLVIVALMALGSFYFSRFIREQLTSASQELSNQIRSSLKSLTSSSDLITNLNVNLSKVDSDLNNIVHIQQEDTQTTVSSTLETSANIEKVKDIVNQTMIDTQEVRSFSSKGKEKVSQMLQAMDGINESNNKIQAFTRVMEEIQEKVKIIDDIVFQTKLLSFNASVEASRAGEHGKGFSVVAEEISNLAAVSGSSAQEIRNLVEESSKQVESVIQENSQKVENGRVLAQSSYDILVDIDERAVKNESSSKIVLTNVEEQVQAIGLINGSVEGLSKSTDKINQVAKTGKDINYQLKSESENLRQIVYQLGQLTGDRRKQPVQRSEKTKLAA